MTVEAAGGASIDPSAMQLTSIPSAASTNPVPQVGVADAAGHSHPADLLGHRLDGGQVAVDRDDVSTGGRRANDLGTVNCHFRTRCITIRDTVEVWPRRSLYDSMKKLNKHSGRWRRRGCLGPMPFVAR